MKFKKIFCIILSAILFAVCIPIYSSAEEAITYVEDEVIFEYDPSLTRARRTRNDFLEELGCIGITELSELETYDEPQITTSAVYSEPTVYVAKISGDVEETCRELEQLDGIAYAEPNYLLQTDSFEIPTEVTNENNIYKNYQKWYINNILHLPEAWESYETAGDNVTIAVIDNGFYTEATDFSTKLWTDANGNHGKNLADDNFDIGPVYKPNGETYLDTAHGTNVAGIIGMSSNGSNGIGAAYNAELMLLKVANNAGGNSASTTAITADSVASAIYYAKRYGAQIITMSLGLLGTSPTVIKNAVNTAYYDGIVVVSAAGNNATATSEQLCYPAAEPNVIGVMATDKTDTSSLTYFSNYDTDGGKYYDIAAPGYSIIGCGVQKGKFTTMMGTSQATPLVAACIALFISAYPGTRVDKIYEAVRNSSKNQAISNSTVSTEKVYKYDMMNALDLLDYGKIKPEIEFNLATNIVHDPKTGYIYGLDEGYADIASYITVKSGTGTTEFIPTTLGNGTGSVLNVYMLDGTLYKSYTVVLFGDINGDCKIDGSDAVLTRCIVSGTLAADTCIKYAADVDFDGEPTETDAVQISEHAIRLNEIPQMR